MRIVAPRLSAVRKLHSDSSRLPVFCFTSQYGSVRRKEKENMSYITS